MVQRFEVFVTTVNTIYRSIQRIKTREMTELGLKGTHVMCLFHLNQYPQGLTASQLSSLCVEDKAAISRAIAKLEEEGFVTLEDRGEKRRYRANILLTELGQQTATHMIGSIENAVIKGGEGLTQEEREIFYKALAMISENLRNYSKEDAIS